ncbi:hypothetical protein WN51_08682 [Melipona quadrifasciata]|uniref:Uncharacterized protein n=1 Tax=Melipona quadrifasciata TaxID=166423 RepID=A0A0M9A9W2_9HYME|nr:hypothetical protein WN51_08682 [Melipona quadrifasciata]
MRRYRGDFGICNSQYAKLIENRDQTNSTTPLSNERMYSYHVNDISVAYHYRLDAVYLYGHDVLKAFARSNTPKEGTDALSVPPTSATGNRGRKVRHKRRMCFARIRESSAPQSNGRGPSLPQNKPQPDGQCFMATQVRSQTGGITAWKTLPNNEGKIKYRTSGDSQQGNVFLESDLSARLGVFYSAPEQYFTFSSYITYEVGNLSREILSTLQTRRLKPETIGSTGNSHLDLDPIRGRRCSDIDEIVEPLELILSHEIVMLEKIPSHFLLRILSECNETLD